MALDPREGLFEFRDFKGLRNTVDARDFDRGDLEVALNVDIDEGDNIDRRKGYSAVVVAGIDRSLFASGPICLGVGSNTLKQILPDYSTITLRSGLTAGRPLSYTAIGSRIFYTNGVEQGAVDNAADRTWGITPPTLGATATAGGALLSGRYQYTLTYLRSDGQESGAPLAQTVDLTSTAGFTITLPVSTDAGVTRKAVYVTARNGETLYRYAVLDNADTTFAVREERPGTVMLATQFLSPPPIGDHIAYANGRLLVAQGNRLYPSEPYAPELFDLRKGVPLIDRINMVQPLRDGTWITTDTQIIWLAHAEPEKWEFVLKAPYGGIPFTGYMDSTSALGEDKGHDPAVFFATARGLCMGAPGGQLVNFTEQRFAYPIQPTGAGVVRRHRGMIQYICSMNGPEIPGNSFA